MKNHGPKAMKSERLFRMNCEVKTTIGANAGTIWALLTDATGFPSWNSTVTSIEGEIADGRTLKLKVPSATGRVFKPRVPKSNPGVR